MCPWIWKGLIIIGLGMAFTGLILMIKAKQVPMPDGGKGGSTTVVRRSFNTGGWILTVVGYAFQVIGVIIS